MGPLALSDLMHLASLLGVCSHRYVPQSTSSELLSHARGEILSFYALIALGHQSLLHHFCLGDYLWIYQYIL